MSVAAVATNFADSFKPQVNYEIVSSCGREAHRLFTSAKNYRRGSAGDWAPIVEASIEAIKAECASDGWDGDGSLAISAETRDLALQVAIGLSRLLPAGSPPPDVIPESDGEICLSWGNARGYIFSLSIGAHGKLNYAGQFGPGGSLHAWQPIRRESAEAFESSLEDVSRYIARLFGAAAEQRGA